MVAGFYFIGKILQLITLQFLTTFQQLQCFPLRSIRLVFDHIDTNALNKHPTKALQASSHIILEFFSYTFLLKRLMLNFVCEIADCKCGLSCSLEFGRPPHHFVSRHVVSIHTDPKTFCMQSFPSIFGIFQSLLFNHCLRLNNCIFQLSMRIISILN